MVLNASMPYLRNTPVGELIQKQGANECVDRKPKEAFGRQVIFHVPGLLLRSRQSISRTGSILMTRTIDLASAGVVHMTGGDFGLSFPLIFAFALPCLKLLFPNIHVAQYFDALSPEHTSRGTYTEARSK